MGGLSNSYGRTAKDGVHHGYGWENKQPYLDSYLNITTETDFINPTGYCF